MSVGFSSVLAMFRWSHVGSTFLSDPNAADAASRNNTGANRFIILNLTEKNILPTLALRLKPKSETLPPCADSGCQLRTELNGRYIITNFYGHLVSAR